MATKLKTKPKCVSSTSYSCGYSCINDKKICRAEVSKANADAILKAIKLRQISGKGSMALSDLADKAAKARTEAGGHDYVASPKTGLSFALAKQAHVDYLKARGLTDAEAVDGEAAIAEWTLSSSQIRQAESGQLSDDYHKGDKAKLVDYARDMNKALSVLPKYEGSIHRGLAFSSELDRDRF